MPEHMRMAWLLLLTDTQCVAEYSTNPAINTYNHVHVVVCVDSGIGTVTIQHVHVTGWATVTYVKGPLKAACLVSACTACAYAHVHWSVQRP